MLIAADEIGRDKVCQRPVQTQVAPAKQHVHVNLSLRQKRQWGGEESTPIKFGWGQKERPLLTDRQGYVAEQ